MLDSPVTYTSLQITRLHKQPQLYGVGPSQPLWVHSTHTINMKVLGLVAWTMEWLQAFSFCFWKGSVSWVNWQCSWVLRPRGVNVPRPTTALVGTQMIFFLFSFSCLKSTDSAFPSRNGSSKLSEQSCWTRQTGVEGLKRQLCYIEIAAWRVTE